MTVLSSNQSKYVKTCQLQTRRSSKSLNRSLIAHCTRERALSPRFGGSNCAGWVCVLNSIFFFLFFPKCSFADCWTQTSNPRVHLWTSKLISAHVKTWSDDPGTLRQFHCPSKCLLDCWDLSTGEAVFLRFAVLWKLSTKFGEKVQNLSRSENDKNIAWFINLKTTSWVLSWMKVNQFVRPSGNHFS